MELVQNFCGAMAGLVFGIGMSVLKLKLDLWINAPMPHSTFDNICLHFLNFLVKIAFNQLDKDGVPKVNWKEVHRAFYDKFSPSVVAQIFSQGTEIALAHRLVRLVVFVSSGLCFCVFFWFSFLVKSLYC
jgi:hypothetical protein